MTSKDYVAIANAITDPTLKLTASKTRAVADRIASAFAADNAQFDREQFTSYIDSRISA